MKTIKLFLVAAIATIAITATSCSKSDDNTNISVPTQYKIIVSANATTNNCSTVSASYHVKAEYISDSNVFDTSTWSGSVNTQIDGEKTTSGNIVGVKLKLTDFNVSDQNSGRGTSLQNVTIKIINVQTNQVLLNKTNAETFSLLICTDTTYEGVLLYNTQTNTYTVSKSEHAF